MLTAHRPSFRTCMFHPRSIHLLCHLDIPSAANLPCLGLQEQARLEVFGLCGIYRVPSRSSLLPLRTLSPRGSLSQVQQLVLPIFNHLSHVERVLYKLANKPLESRHKHPREALDRCNGITRLSRDETLMFSQFGNTG
jgi:hypothetical protein